MDPQRFDAWTRALTRATSRRRVLRRLSLGVFGTALAPLGTARAQAICPEDQVFRRGIGCVCRTTGRPPVDGQCPCRSGTTACGGECVQCPAGTELDPGTCGCCIRAGWPGCVDNADCCSGICANGTCAAAQQEPGGVCDENADCVSGLCCGTTCASTDLAGWTPLESGTADVSVVCGPGTPPLPPESAQLSVGTDGSGAAQVGTAAHNGTALGSLQLSYSSYVQQDGSGGQAPYVILRVDYTGDGASDDLLFFEPVYQDSTFCSNPQGGPAVGTWQTWDADAGCWWSVNGTAGAGPGTGVKTLSQILAAQPSATLATDTTSIRLVAGFGAGAWDNFVGNVDNVTVNGTTYDF